MSIYQTKTKVGRRVDKIVVDTNLYWYLHIVNAEKIADDNKKNSPHVNDDYRLIDRFYSNIRVTLAFMSRSYFRDYDNRKTINEITDCYAYE